MPHLISLLEQKMREVENLLRNIGQGTRVEIHITTTLEERYEVHTKDDKIMPCVAYEEIPVVSKICIEGKHVKRCILFYDGKNPREYLLSKVEEKLKVLQDRYHFIIDYKLP